MGGGQVVPPQAGMAPQVAPARVVLKNSWFEAVKVAKAAVSATNTEAIAKLEKLGITSLFKVKDKNNNPHEVAHAVRETALLAVLKTVSALNQPPPVVVSVYGADRDHCVVEHVNDMLNPGVARARMIVHGDAVVPQDINRRQRFGDIRSLPTIVAADHPTVAVMTDVYCSTRDQFLTLIGHVLDYVPEIYWIGFQFDGAMGAHFDGAWVRRSDGSIVSKPDRYSTPYGPHYDPVEVSLGGRFSIPAPSGATTHFQAAPYLHFEHYVVSKIVACPAGLPESPVRLTPEIGWTVMDLVVPKNIGAALIMEKVPLLYYAAGSMFSQKQRALVDFRASCDLQGWLEPKDRQSYSFKQAHLHLSKLLDSAAFKQVKEFFPVEAAVLVHDTSIHAYTHGVPKRSLLLRALRAQFAPTFAKINESVSQLDKPETDWSWSILKYASLAAAGCVVLAMIGSRQTGGLFHHMPAAGGSVANMLRTMKIGASRVWAAVSRGLVHLACVVGPSVQRGAMSTLRGAHRVGVGAMGAVKTALSLPMPAWANYGLPTQPTTLWSWLVNPMEIGGIVVHASYEEVWKRLVKFSVRGIPIYLGYYLLSGAEVAMMLYAGPSYGLSSWDMLKTACLNPLMHAWWMVQPFWMGVVLHSLHNYMYWRRNTNGAAFSPSGSAKSLAAWSVGMGCVLAGAVVLWGLKQIVPRVPSRWSAFKQQHYETPWGLRPAVTVASDVGISSYPASEALVPRQSVHCEIPAQALDIPVHGSLTPAEREQQPIHMLLPTSQPVYAPRRDDETLLVATLTRITAAPPMDVEVQRHAWKFVPDVVSQHNDPMVYEELLQPWLEHLRPNPMAYHRAVNALKLVDVVPLDFDSKFTKSTHGMAKTDEVLMRIGGEGFMEMKPRVIIELPPQFQVTVGPYVYQYSQLLKTVLWGWDSPRQVGRWTIYIHYGGAMTDLELSHWWDRTAMLAPPAGPVACILVGGDDSLVVLLWPSGEITIVEGDFGMFDQTQSEGPLNWQYRQMHRAYVPRQITRFLQQIAHGRIVVSSTRRGEAAMVVDLAKHPQRLTGGSDTSCGNSTTNAGSTVYVIAVRESFSGPRDTWAAKAEAAYAELGFKAKLRFPSHIGLATFLKGRWYAVTGYELERFWGPLPSRVLKVGKSERDPRTVTGLREYHQAAKAYLGAVAQSYSKFLAVPVLRAFVRNFQAVKSVKVVRLKDQLRVLSWGGGWTLQLNEELTWAELAEHYGVEARFLVDLERLFARADEPFRFLEHPAFTAMALRDYN